MKPIVILGSKGMLGQALMSAFSDQQPIGLDREEIDLTDAEVTRSKLTAFTPRVIINAAAYNAVDACEDKKQEAEAAMAMNGTAVETLSSIANEVSALLIHYSTDYVFDGKKPEGYVETDAPNPISVYGRSKLHGEQAVQTTARRYYVIRLSRLFGRPAASQMGKKSFVDLMIEKGRSEREVRVVSDERSCPTYAPDLAQLTKALTREHHPYGIYHGANFGASTWFEFAQAIFQLAGVSTSVTPVPSSAFPRKAPRPSYSELLNTKLPPQRSWQDALNEYLHQRSWV